MKEFEYRHVLYSDVNVAFEEMHKLKGWEAFSITYTYYKAVEVWYKREVQNV